jgi:hypothetical protein
MEDIDKIYQNLDAVRNDGFRSWDSGNYNTPNITEYDGDSKVLEIPESAETMVLPLGDKPIGIYLPSGIISFYSIADLPSSLTFMGYSGTVSHFSALSSAADTLTQNARGSTSVHWYTGSSLTKVVCSDGDFSL